MSLSKLTDCTCAINSPNTFPVTPFDHERVLTLLTDAKSLLEVLQHVNLPDLSTVTLHDYLSVLDDLVQGAWQQLDQSA